MPNDVVDTRAAAPGGGPAAGGPPAAVPGAAAPTQGGAAPPAASPQQGQATPGAGAGAGPTGQQRDPWAIANAESKRRADMQAEFDRQRALLKQLGDNPEAELQRLRAVEAEAKKAQASQMAQQPAQQAQAQPQTYQQPQTQAQASAAAMMMQLGAGQQLTPLHQQYILDMAMNDLGQRQNGADAEMAKAFWSPFLRKCGVVVPWEPQQQFMAQQPAQGVPGQMLTREEADRLIAERMSQYDRSAEQRARQFNREMSEVRAELADPQGVWFQQPIQQANGETVTRQEYLEDYCTQNNLTPRQGLLALWPQAIMTRYRELGMQDAINSRMNLGQPGTGPGTMPEPTTEQKQRAALLTRYGVVGDGYSATRPADAGPVVRDYDGGRERR